MDTEPQLVQLGLPGQQQLGEQDLAQLCSNAHQYGFALYEFMHHDNDELRASRQAAVQLYKNLGLTQPDTGIISAEDNLSLLENSNDEKQRRFVPYSNRTMNWHTDGYYNAPTEAINCFCLHCLRPAQQGGELSLMDDHLLLIALYEKEPAAVALLAHPEAMMLPSSQDEYGHSRPDRWVAVFAASPVNGLQTRFTTRQRNITWRDEETKQAALTAIQVIEDQSSWHATVRLGSGQGVVTRNILHRRSAFEDNAPDTNRQMLRGRYLQRPASQRTAD